MRKLIYAINVTVDGCCEHTEMLPPEVFDAAGSDEMLEYWTQVLRDADVFVYGRKTYQLMVPYWPDVAKDPSASKGDREFARAFEAAKKLIFSRSLDEAEVRKGDKTARVVRTDLRDEILKLKQEPGKNILAGGVDLPSQLMELGLVDEYRFVVQPILGGEGRRLLDGVRLPEKLRLKLVESKIFKSGCIALRYLKP